MTAPMNIEQALGTIRVLGRSLIADDNKNDHFTAHPQFTVQKKKRIYGFDTDYSDRIVWIDAANGYREASPDEHAQLEAAYGSLEEASEEWRRTGYRDEWAHVEAFITYEAAKDRAASLNQRHGEGSHRTYVESAHRNHEWQMLRAAMITIANHRD